MSAAELTANGENISAGAAQKIDEAIGRLLDAQRMVCALQEQFVPFGDMTVDACTIWNKLETIDDRLHEALSKLGN